jgi:ATP-dependent protease ClpP protease subunit
MRPALNRLALLALYGLAAVMAWQFHQRLYQDTGQFAVEHDRAAGALVLSWKGEIERPMAHQFHEAFAARKDEAGRIVIDLDSPGGSLAEGRQVIEVIDLMKRTHRVDTRVEANRRCLSMCVPIFLQGQERLAAASSRWMFHEPRFIDAFTGEDVKKPQFQRTYAARSFFERYLRNSDVDGAWLDRIEEVAKEKEVWRTGRQLFDEKSNVVTRLM